VIITKTDGTSLLIYSKKGGAGSFSGEEKQLKLIEDIKAFIK
jgi:hypothetical protein